MSIIILPAALRPESKALGIRIRKPVTIRDRRVFLLHRGAHGEAAIFQTPAMALVRLARCDLTDHVTLELAEIHPREFLKRLGALCEDVARRASCGEAGDSFDGMHLEDGVLRLEGRSVPIFVEGGRAPLRSSESLPEGSRVHAIFAIDSIFANGGGGGRGINIRLLQAVSPRVSSLRDFSKPAIADDDDILPHKQKPKPPPPPPPLPPPPGPRGPPAPPRKPPPPPPPLPPPPALARPPPSIKKDVREPKSGSVATTSTPSLQDIVSAMGRLRPCQPDAADEKKSKNPQGPPSLQEITEARARLKKSERERRVPVTAWDDGTRPYLKDIASGNYRLRPVEKD